MVSPTWLRVRVSTMSAPGAISTPSRNWLRSSGRPILDEGRGTAEGARIKPKVLFDPAGLLAAALGRMLMP